VPSLDITDQAVDFIERRSNDPAVVRLKGKKDIPLLLWSNKSYFDDNSGRRTESPQFYFYWTDTAEIEQYRYFKVDFANGRKLALAPGDLFQSGSHRIDLKADKLVLDDRT